MQATYTFAARYYTSEVHERFKEFYEDVSFASVQIDNPISYNDFISSFEDTLDTGEHMLEIEFEEFDRKETTFNDMLMAEKIPFERMYYAYDGYDGLRTVIYPDGTRYNEYLDAEDHAFIPVSAFNEFFVPGDIPYINTTKLTADNFKRVIDENTLRFKRKARYFANNEFIFLDKKDRESIEDVLAKYDNGQLTQDEAFKRIAEIKKSEREEITEMFAED